jgi:hypothetical protein
MLPGRLLLLVLIAPLPIVGCGSSSSQDSTSQEQTATATTPQAPPGAAVRTCEGTVAGTGELRVTGIGCDVGRGVVAAWANEPSCSTADGASRFSCSVYEDYRCLGATTEHGIAVSCTRSGASASFVAQTRLS